MLTFNTKTDQIHFILDQIGMRLKVKQIIDCLALIEELSDSDSDDNDSDSEVVLAIVKGDNEERIKQDIFPRFKIYENEFSASSCILAIESFDISQLNYSRTLLELSGLQQPKTPEAELQELRENFMQKWALQIPSLIEENYGTTTGNKGFSH